MTHYLEKFNSIPEAFFERAAQHPDTELYRQATIAEDGTRSWPKHNYREVSARVCKIAAALAELGVKKGDRVAIISQSRPEWLEADLAILSLGAVSVSIYQSLAAGEIGYILYDSEAQVVFAENQEQVDKLLELLNRPCDIPATEERPATQARITLRAIVSFEEAAAHELVRLYSALCEAPAAPVPAAVAEIKRADLATFVYTSGTTGPPKGVMQTHGNHLSNCRQACVAGVLKPGASIMIFLPLAHAFAKLMGYLASVTDASLRFPAITNKKSSAADPASITRDIREGSASVVPLVPRMLEKMQAGVRAKSLGSGFSQKLLKMTLWAAQEVYAAREKGQSAGILAQIAYQGSSSIREKIKRQLFGPNFNYGISGGAKLNPDVARFFDALGIDIYEGFGLTETCVATNINPIGRKKIGTVGPVLDKDIELRISDDGEIIFRGPNVSLGYYKREAATRAAWTGDGWFHTGDLGQIDEDGYLSIVGRKKDIIVTSYGKNIAPEDIEARIKSSPYISQVVMVGDGRAYCTALITLDEPQVKEWMKSKGAAANGNLAENKDVFRLIWNEVEQVNKTLSGYEAIKKIAILPGDFSVENGLLTPTFKVKKKLVIEQHLKEIEALYAG